MSSRESDGVNRAWLVPWWLIAGAVLLPCLYLPTLSARFDFNDDGCLVYPTEGLQPAGFLDLVWHKTMGDFEVTGPFRPVTWAHFEAAANLFGPHALPRRVARIGWAMLSCALFLWLLIELGIDRCAALLTAAVAMWNPYRNEIWMAFGLTEGFAMPYAMLALVSAVRAARSERPWPWDFLSVIAMILALGCKNTMAAVVPAAVFLRIAGDGLPLREGLKRHGPRAIFLALTLLLPIGHFIAIKLTHQAGNKMGFSADQVAAAWSSAVGNAISLEVLGPILAIIGLLVWRQSRLHPPVVGDTLAGPERPRLAWKTPVIAGLLLLVFGLGIYFPVRGVAARYSMPAVWGADLCLAVGLNFLTTLPKTFWTSRFCQRSAFGLLGVALAILAVCNLARQTKYIARADLLWQALEQVERQAPPDAHLVWCGAFLPDSKQEVLDLGEGFHFACHLHSRGRSDIVIDPVDVQKAPGPTNRDALTTASFALSAVRSAPEGTNWHILKDYRAPFWLGLRSYHCYLWARP